MRRSIGVKAAEPPRRLRQSQEFHEGGLGSANRQSRPRPSLARGASSDASGGGRRQSSSQSRLPVLQQQVVKTKGQRSSSSGGGPLSERNRNSMITPKQGQGAVKRASSGARSSDRLGGKPRLDYQTPQRVHQVATGRKSLVQGTGTANKRLSGRGSQVGAKVVKDTRPLGDKEFQVAQTRRILDFLRTNGYHNTTLTSKNFPLQTREFVAVFNFIYNHINPYTEEVLSYPGFHEPIIALLKDLSYPGNIPRSHFVTLGSQHSWPAVLGCLSFLCDLASTYVMKLQPNVNAIGFPSDFSTDRETREKLTFEHHLACFGVFNEGHDDYDEQEEQLQEVLMENMGVDIERLHRLRKHGADLEAELHQLEGQGNVLADLEHQRVAKQSDVDKLNEYLHRRESRNHVKKEDLERKEREVVEGGAQLEELKTKAEELRSASEQNKVSSCEAERITALIEEKRARLDTKKAEVDEVDKELFQKELTMSKMVGVLDDLAKQANTLALNEDLKSRTGERIMLPKTRFTKDKGASALPAEVKPELNDLLKAKRAELRGREREIQQQGEYSKHCKEQLILKKQDLQALRIEVGKVEEEVQESKLDNKKSEEELDKQLLAAREEMVALRRREVGDRLGKERELEEAVGQLNMVREERRRKKEEGDQFLQQVLDQSVTHMEQSTQQRDSAAAIVLAQARSNVESVRATAQAVVQIADTALEAASKRPSPPSR